MYACESGNPQCVQALLENGASVNFSVSDDINILFGVTLQCSCLATVNESTFSYFTFILHEHIHISVSSQANVGPW